MTWRTVVVLGPAAITIEDKRARDTPDTSQEIVVFARAIPTPISTYTWWQDCAGPIWMCQDTEPIFIEGNRFLSDVFGLACTGSGGELGIRTPEPSRANGFQ